MSNSCIVFGSYFMYFNNKSQYVEKRFYLKILGLKKECFLPSSIINKT